MNQTFYTRKKQKNTHEILFRSVKKSFVAAVIFMGLVILSVGIAGTGQSAGRLVVLALLLFGGGFLFCLAVFGMLEWSLARKNHEEKS